jgi:hypothetical protein
MLKVWYYEKPDAFSPFGPGTLRIYGPLGNDILD